MLFRSIIFRLTSFSTISESASLNPVMCLEAPLSINYTSIVLGGDAAERADTRINSFLLSSKTFSSSYLDFLDLFEGLPISAGGSLPFLDLLERAFSTIVT